MSENYFEDEQFDTIDFTARPFVKGEYENCRFINCNFANIDLSNARFIECEFTGCNISMTKITGATLNTVKFKESKIIGINFETCNDFLFSVEFDNCIMNFSSFYKRVMKKTLFKDCTLHEVDFTDTDLSGSSFIKCDFHKAKFENTNLEKSDFRSSFNYALDPARDAVYSNMDIESLINGLQRFDLPILTLSSKVSTRQEYLQRPDLGRLVDEESEKKVVEFSSPNDISLMITDGLSATAINHNLLPLLEILLPALKSAGLKPGPVSIIKQGRVAIGDPVAYGLKSKIALMLIGERPGLSAADSIGAYITYDPKPGLTDESRNCVSNIRPRGLSFEKASEKILYIITQAIQRKLSGTSLKDNAGLMGE